MQNVNPDLNRFERIGKPEAIYAEGKSLEELREIVEIYLKAEKPVIVTRLNKEQAELMKKMGLKVNEKGRIAVKGKLVENSGTVVIITAGTSDVSVAEEAAETAEFLGLKVYKFYDVGIAGIHRVGKAVEFIKSNEVDSAIVIAGMEGALPSVVAALIDLPVIAVPTSVGYGVNLGGLTTLFSMLQSCPAGVAVMNIDNGFGAAVFAYLISRVKSKRDKNHC
ncbi:MAG: nickel pincer cofactor biosynthesis protein LarB [Archaeoglobaceae archaeon]|nr:nickel pincer cofactor biosynthesis protein LarB [Archaeoglobaceae archaeon]MCX8152477.1 nickel pincer cofactor biosynthesis protein LarB [Archaeoglobaceae archaeon]MDW8013708.1 nickel pincer cofactor biosynthesis protein LarB [Archaeoglobaceae archaeon]